MMNLIEAFFAAACRQLWLDYVSIPQYHLWALDIMRAHRAKVTS